MARATRNHALLLDVQGKKKNPKYFYDSWDSQPGCPRMRVSCGVVPEDVQGPESFQQQNLCEDAHSEASVML